MSAYTTFLERKRRSTAPAGIDVDPASLHPKLHDFQRAGAVWAINAGRSALFWDCGMGKTFAQLEWARHSGRRALIVAPLSVARQTVREAEAIDLDVHYEVIAAHIAAGWIFHGEVTVDKDPQAQAIRTKAQALMFNTLNRDSSMSRPAMADYVLIFRKPGENAEPIKPDCDNETWIQWARPVWYEIRESDTLNGRVAREDADERHIAPLQLGLIDRCVRLWSNEGETVLSPFAGIGSEGVMSLRNGRRFVGCELKPSYWKVARENLERETGQIRLTGGSSMDEEVAA